MIKSTDHKSRILFWTLLIMTLILIAGGYWFVNGAVWLNLGAAIRQEHSISQDLVDNLRVIKDQVEQDFKLFEEEIVSEFTAELRRQQEAQATAAVVEAMLEKLDLETNEPNETSEEIYDEEENNQETGEERKE